MSFEIFDPHNCILGEGPLWHPKANILFWFDIKAQQFWFKKGSAVSCHQFDRYVSAAAWIDEANLLIADEFGLFKFDWQTKFETRLAEIEKDNAITRSNDGRADPFGGFWIGTMGKNAEHEAGAIYRFYRGEVRQLFDKITISNSICFSPDKKFAYFVDSIIKKIMRVELSEVDGWPKSAPEVFIDLSDQNFEPDGSVVDAEGNLWNAQWGAGRVAKYSADGEFIKAYDLPASQTTCPAFIGENADQLIVTSAQIGREAEEPEAGKMFLVQADAKGQFEHQVHLK